LLTTLHGARLPALETWQPRVEDRYPQLLVLDSLSTLISEGRAANRPAPVPSGGLRVGRADAGRPASATALVSSDRAVTATSSNIVARHPGPW